MTFCLIFLFSIPLCFNAFAMFFGDLLLESKRDTPKKKTTRNTAKSGRSRARITFYENFSLWCKQEWNLQLLARSKTGCRGDVFVISANDHLDLCDGWAPLLWNKSANCGTILRAVISPKPWFVMLQSHRCTSLRCELLTPHAFESLNSPWTSEVQERGNVSFLLPSIRLSFKRALLRNRWIQLPWQSANLSPCLFSCFFFCESSLWCLWGLIVTTVMW